MSKAAGCVRWIFRLASWLAIGLTLTPMAQSRESRPPSIGVLVFATNSPYETGLREGLRQLGYAEGKNIEIKWARSDGTAKDQRSVVAELVRSNPDVMVLYSTLAARAALEGTQTIPILFVSSDPIAAGLAQSLARPGKNATGVADFGTELTAKRLQLLYEAVPRARRFGCLYNSTNPLGVAYLSAAKQAAAKLGLVVLPLDIRSQAELDKTLQELTLKTMDALVVTNDTLIVANRSSVSTAVRKAMLPAIFPFREFHEDGVLMSYSLNYREAGKKLAVYVDRILKGAKTSELPIEQLSMYDFIIDLRIARETNLKVPNDLILQAHELIR